jgi:hypothetical protein
LEAAKSPLQHSHNTLGVSMSPRRSSRIAVHVAVLLVAASLSTAQAVAANPKSAPGAASSGKNQPGKVTFREAPSAEKPAERAKRLKRECKGRPNAGMCLGHAS